MRKTIIRIISIFLTLTFVSQDIVRANPQLSLSKNTLQQSSACSASPANNACKSEIEDALVGAMLNGEDRAVVKNSGDPIVGEICVVKVDAKDVQGAGAVVSGSISPDEAFYLTARKYIEDYYTELKNGAFAEAADKMRIGADDITMAATALVEGITDTHPRMPAGLVEYENIFSNSNISGVEFDKDEYVRFINVNLQKFFGTNIPAITPDQIVIVKDVYGGETGFPARALRMFGKILISEKILSNKELLEWILIHEALHLIFPGIDKDYLNEAVTEWLTQHILRKRSFGIYKARVDVLGFILNLERDERLIKALIKAYRTGDLTALRREIDEISFVLLIHLNLFHFEDQLLWELIRSQDFYAMLKKKLDIQRDENREILSGVNQGRDFFTEKDTVLKAIDELHKKALGIGRGVRSHRFPRIIKGQDFHQLFRQNMFNEGIPPEEADRILREGLKRTTPTGIIEESAQIKEIARRTLSSVLGREVTLFVLEEILNFHEELHSVITAEDANIIRNNVIKELGLEKYELLKTYFQNLYGDYSDESELVEEIVVTMYTERALGNYLRVLPDRNNPASLTEYKSIEGLEKLGKIVKMSIEPYLRTEIDARNADVEYNIDRGTRVQGSSTTLSLKWRNARKVLERMLDAFSAEDLKVLLEIGKGHLGEIQKQRLSEDWERIKRKYVSVTGLPATVDDAGDILHESNGNSIVYAAIKAKGTDTGDETSRDGIPGGRALQPRLGFREMVKLIRDEASRQERGLPRDVRLGDQDEFVEFRQSPLVRELFKLMEDLAEFYQLREGRYTQMFGQKTIKSEVNISNSEKSITMFFGVNKREAEKVDFSLPAWLNEAVMELKITFYKRYAEVGLIYNKNKKPIILGHVDIDIREYSFDASGTRDKIYRIIPKIRDILCEGIRKVHRYYGVPVHDQFQGRLYEKLKNRLEQKEGLNNPKSLSKAEYWRSEADDYGDNETPMLLADMFADCYELTGHLFLSKAKQDYDGWKTGQPFYLGLFIDRYPQQLLAYFKELEESGLLESQELYNKTEKWTRKGFYNFSNLFIFIRSTGMAFGVDSIFKRELLPNLLMLSDEELSEFAEQLPNSLESLKDYAINDIPLPPNMDGTMYGKVKDIIEGIKDRLERAGVPHEDIQEIFEKILNLVMNDIAFTKDCAGYYGYRFKNNAKILQFLKSLYAGGNIVKYDLPESDDEDLYLRLLDIFAEKIYKEGGTLGNGDGLPNRELSVKKLSVRQALEELGLEYSETPDMEEVKDTYRRIAFEMHPDKSIHRITDEAKKQGLSGEEAERYVTEKMKEAGRRFRNAQTAYEFLQKRFSERQGEGEAGTGSVSSENIGKDIIFIVRENIVTIKTVAGEILAEKPLEDRVLGTGRKASIRSLAKKLIAGDQEVFISFLENLSVIRLFEGEPETRKKSAFANMTDNGEMVIDSVMADNDMVIIHEALHKFLKGKDIKTEIERSGMPKDLKEKILAKAGDDPVALRHYYARYYLQTVKDGVSDELLNEELTYEIKLNSLAGLLGVVDKQKLAEFKGLLDNLKDSTPTFKLRVAFIKLIKADGKVTEDEVKLLVNNISAVRDKLDKLLQFVNIEQKKEAIKRLALYLSIEHLRRIELEGKAPSFIKELVDALPIEEVNRGQALEKISRFTNKDFGIVNVFLEELLNGFGADKIGVQVEKARKYLYNKSETAKALKIKQGKIEDTGGVRDVSEIITKYLRGRKNGGKVADIIARYLSGERFDEKIEASINSIINSKDINKDAQVPSIGRSYLDKIRVNIADTVEIKENTVFVQHVSLYLSGSDRWNSENISSGIVSVINKLFGRDGLYFIYDSEEEKGRFINLLTQKGLNESVVRQHCVTYEEAKAKGKIVWAIRDKDDPRFAGRDLQNERVIAAGEEIIDLYFIWKMSLLYGRFGTLNLTEDDGFWADVRAFLKDYYDNDEELISEAISAIERGRGLWLILPKISPFIRGFINALDSARELIDMAA